jgi:carbonic anhydrase
MTVTDELVRNAEAYAASFDKGDLPLPPGRKIAIVACMDARLNPYGLLGLTEGDAHVIRNAGGVVTDDEIRSLAISQRLLGTEEIVLIHHTDCGMLTFTDDEFKRAVQDEVGIKPEWGARVVHRPRRGRPPVDCPYPGLAVHPAQGVRPRLRLRRANRCSSGGRLVADPAPFWVSPTAPSRAGPARPPVQMRPAHQ